MAKRPQTCHALSVPQHECASSARRKTSSRSAYERRRLLRAPVNGVRRRVRGPAATFGSPLVALSLFEPRPLEKPFFSMKTVTFARPRRCRRKTGVLRGTATPEHVEQQRWHASSMPSVTFVLHKSLTHPQACIQVRLSGPCFKTGRVLPFPLQAPRARMQPRTFARWGELPCS